MPLYTPNENITECHVVLGIPIRRVLHANRCSLKCVYMGQVRRYLSSGVYLSDENVSKYSWIHVDIKDFIITPMSRNGKISRVCTTIYLYGEIRVFDRDIFNIYSRFDPYVYMCTQRTRSSHGIFTNSSLIEYEIYTLRVFPCLY